MDATIYFGTGNMSRVAGSGDEMWRSVLREDASTFVRITNDSNVRSIPSIPSRRQAESLFEAFIIFDGHSELEARNVEGTLHYLFHGLPIGIPITNWTVQIIAIFLVTPGLPLPTVKELKLYFLRTAIDT